MSRPVLRGMFVSVRSMDRPDALGPGEDALAAAQVALLAGLQVEQPGYVRARYQRLAEILEMVADDGWLVLAADRQRVFNALAGFARARMDAGIDPLTLIEFASRELRHDLDAYHDFRQLRAAAAQRHSPHDADRARWLAERRDALQFRMRRLRERDQYSTAGILRRWRSLLNL